MEHKQTAALCTIYVVKSKLVKVGQSLAENLKSAKKCIMIRSARTGKGCITWRMFRTLYTPSSRRAEKSVTVFYAMRSPSQSSISRPCRRCRQSATRFVSERERKRMELFRGHWTAQPRIFGRMAADESCGPTGSKNLRQRKNWFPWSPRSCGLTVRDKSFWTTFESEDVELRLTVRRDSSAIWSLWIMRHDAYHKTDGLPSLHGSPPSLQKLCPDLGRITAQNPSQLGTDFWSSFWKSALCSIRFCGLTIPLTTE